jgi:N-acetylneuraminate synthase
MFNILEHEIGLHVPPFIIAEISANHNGSLEIAKQTIRAAKNAGASAVKIQSYTQDTMTIDCDKRDFMIEEGLWKGKKLFDLYKEAGTPYEWHQELFEFAREEDILIFSTPFDETAVDLLVSLNTPAFKIASFEITDLPLIKYIARQKRPILISTGMSTLHEINNAVETILKEGNNTILLFHCISGYPTPVSQTNLGNIKILADRFNLPVGLSDHTLTNISSVASISIGAVAIEKHFILDKKLGGPDASFSLEPDQFKSLVADCNDVYEALRNKDFSRSKVEEKNKKFRRSLYFIENLAAGTIIEEKHLRRIRPGYGLSPSMLPQILGKRLKTHVERGTPVSFDVFYI